MNRYIMTLATELDGHAGATTAFINSEDVLTRPQALLLINQIYSGGSIFIESEDSLQRKDPAYYNGDIVEYMGTNEYRTPVSITVMKLPSKLVKNKVYITEARTG
jgi:hypothetical protein